MDESLFVRVIVKDRIKLQAKDLGADVRQKINERLVGKYESVCSHHGYIRRGSIDILKVSLGRVEMATLNGDATFNVQYSADVCNPAVGSIVKAHIVNMNKFGILAESGVRLEDGKYVPILDIIIAKQSVNHPSDVDLDSLHINDEIFVEVLGRKYELNDAHISVVGRVVANIATSTAAAAAPPAENGDAESDEDDDAGGEASDEDNENDELFSFDGSVDLEKGPDEEDDDDEPVAESQEGEFASDNEDYFGDLAPDGGSEVEDDGASAVDED
jgi:DNA-directed RNA polymerase subunit E'/Rpb7